jgi:UDP-N-acetylmuramate--alanine ligase
MSAVHERFGQGTAMTAGNDWRAILALPAAARPAWRLHLVGIGGSGLSAIAVVLLQMAYRVSGSDQAANEATAGLAELGATIYIGHAAEHVAGAAVVLISSAVSETNPEVQAARAAGIAVVKRSEFLGPLLAVRYAIGIAGTHGKTTTTAMLALILWRAGLDPGFIVGGRLAELGLAGSAARAGSGPFVIEADEYDRMFLGLPLQTAIVTNVEWDHVDCYPSSESYRVAFRQFVAQLPVGGHLVLCADDPGALALAGAAGPGITVDTYGLEPAHEPAWQARELQSNAAGGLSAEITFRGELVARLALAVPGRHNVRNALAALAAANQLGVAPEVAAGILSEYRGAGRRFEVTGEAGGVTIIDDYGHHPTEIAATLDAARQRYGSRRLWAVFQPHTYTRFTTLLDDFAHSLAAADRVVLLDIYAAREANEGQVHSRQLLERLPDRQAHYAGTVPAAAEYLLAQVAPGDVVITLSAGSGNQAGHRLLAGLHERAAARKTAVPGRPDEHEAVSNRRDLAGAYPRPPAPEPGQARTEVLQALVKAASALGLTVTANESLARHTTFRIGGPAELFAPANDPGQMIALARLAAEYSLPITVLGGGSNVLIGDAGMRGLVIANQCRGMRVVEDNPFPVGAAPQVVGEAGAPLAGLARWAMRGGWQGLEWAVSVPGTVGGAVIGNAGAHCGQIADNLAWVEVAWPGGERPGGGRQYLPAEELRLTYRSSVLKAALAEGRDLPLVLAAGFQLARGDPATLTARADEFLARRRATQPVEPSAGSIFRNPPGDHAGRLIETAGLKGHQIGGAQVSPRHANFIINVANARAADVAALITLIQTRVYELFAIKLWPEILFLGDWPDRSHHNLFDWQPPAGAAG